MDAVFVRRVGRMTAVLAFLADVAFGGAAEATPSPPAWVAPTAEDADLVRRLEEAIATTPGTPARENANWFLVSRKDLLLKLKGERPATAPQMEEARRAARSGIELLPMGRSWPLPRPVLVPMARTPPRMDGALDDPAWSSAASFDGLYPFNQTNRLESPATSWKVMWDSNALYFAFACADDVIDAPPIPRDGNVFFHDCVEMFLLSDTRVGAYWEIVVSPSASIYDGLNTKHFGDWGSQGRPGENIEGLAVGVSTNGVWTRTGESPGQERKSGYTVEVAVPFGELPSYTRGNPPRPGDRLGIMLVRLDGDGGAVQAFSFQPLMAWGHNIWNHAELRLLPPAAESVTAEGR